MIEYRYLQPADAEQAADIHIEGQPGTVLTLLGRQFLIELYRAVATSEWGEGIGAFDDGKLVAQTAMAVSSDKFFSEFKRKHLWKVILPVIWAVLHNPKILLYVVQGWNYAGQTLSPEREGDVLFLGVTHSYMRAGIAPEVVRHMFGWADYIGLTSANFMIEKRNRPIRWMISRLNGLYIAHEFEAYGRAMLFYKVPISANSATACLPDGEPCTQAHIYTAENSIPAPPPSTWSGKLAATIFALLSLVHLYWAAGGTVGINVVIPTDDKAPLFQPSPLATLSVAGGLCLSMLTILGRIGVWGRAIPATFFQWGTFGLSLLFLGRAIGDFRWVGFFKRVKHTAFAKWDSWLFSPLCLLIAFLLTKSNLSR